MSFLFTSPPSGKDEIKSAVVSAQNLSATAVTSKSSGGRGARKVIRDLTVARLTDPKSCTQRVFSTETPMGFKLACGDNVPWNTIQTIANLTTVASSTTLEVDAGLSFSVTTLGVSASLLGAFDQYRIMEIEVMFIQRRQATTATANPGTFAVVVDYDNNTAATLAVLDNYANVQIGSGIDSFYTRFVPHSSMSMGTTAGGVTSGGNLTRQWIDSANSTVAHFGVKYAWSTSTDVVYTKDISVRAWIQFRNVF